MDLCSKGPSFVPTPISYDWNQLQKDFDLFQSKLRAVVFFANKQSNITEDQGEITNPPWQKSSWKASKCNIPELETFLSLVERDLFSDTKRKTVTDNLDGQERKALNDWRKNTLFNENSDLIMRLHDKDNRFIVVDKDTDIAKAEEQIGRSSFVKLHYDPTLEHIEKVVNWAEKWYKKGQISLQWKQFVVNMEAQPGKKCDTV